MEESTDLSALCVLKKSVITDLNLITMAPAIKKGIEVIKVLKGKGRKVLKTSKIDLLLLKLFF